MDHRPRTQHSPVQRGPADPVEVGVMRPVRRGNPGEIHPSSTAVVEVEQGRAAEEPADGPITGGQGFESRHDARNQIHEGLPFCYVTGRIDDDILMLENACQIRCRRSCQIGLVHRHFLSNLGRRLRRGPHQGRYCVVRRNRLLRHVATEGARCPRGSVLWTSRASGCRNVFVDQVPASGRPARKMSRCCSLEPPGAPRLRARCSARPPRGRSSSTAA